MKFTTLCIAIPGENHLCCPGKGSKFSLKILKTIPDAAKHPSEKNKGKAVRH